MNSIDISALTNMRLERPLSCEYWARIAINSKKITGEFGFNKPSMSLGDMIAQKQLLKEYIIDNAKVIDKSLRRLAKMEEEISILEKQEEE